MTGMIFKILAPAADAQMQADGALTVSGVDAVDGYVHFSTASQLGETLDKHYAGHGALVLLAVTADSLGDDVRWEVSRNGDKFPHLYASFRADMVAARFALNAQRDGLTDWLKGLSA